MRSYCILALLALTALVRGSPVAEAEKPLDAKSRKSPDSSQIQPSPPDPLRKRDGAHHGGGASSFSSVGTSSYATAPNSFVGGAGREGGFGASGGGFGASGGGLGASGGGFGASGGGFGASGGGFGASGGGLGASGGGYGAPVGIGSGAGKGFAGSGIGGGHSKGFAASGLGGGFGGSGKGGGGFGGSGHGISNHIGGSGYGPPPVQPSYAEPAKQTGYYYYYYPVQVEEGGKKESEKGFMDKMKKLFEPMMYPWNAMMDYLGYGSDYDYDYDYDSYGVYARSFVNRASEYVPWDAVDEVSNVVTQDQCIEYFACQLGSYGRDYNNAHFLLDYLLPEENISDNSYYRSFKHSILQKTDCGTYSCPLVRRRTEQVN